MNNGLIRFTINVDDPNAMVEWIQENLPAGCVVHISALEIELDHGSHYEVSLQMNDANQATLLKTVWAKG